MKKIAAHSLLWLGLLLAAEGGQAQTANAERAQNTRAELEKRFASADSNGDGQLTREEAKAGMPRVYRNFDAIDSAHTGAVTMRQIMAYAAAQRGQQQK